MLSNGYLTSRMLPADSPQWRLRLHEMEFNVFHCAVIKHQAPDRLSPLSTSKEDCTPIDDTSQLMWTGSPPYDEEKRRIKFSNAIDNCDDAGANTTSPGLPAVCPIATPRADTTTPTLAELSIEQHKDVFCQQVADTVWTPGLCYSYNSHGIPLHTTSLDSTLQTVVPKLPSTTPTLRSSLW